jgi:hypothetical protein
MKTSPSGTKETIQINLNASNNLLVFGVSIIMGFRRSLEVSGEHDKQAPQASPPKKTTIKAKEFVAAFREHPDDFHLMVMFSITKEQLKTIYSALLAKGLLSEYEYNCRERKLLEPDEKEWRSPSASEVANLIENPSEVMAELLYSGHEKDPNVARALKELQAKKEFDKKRFRT